MALTFPVDPVVELYMNGWIDITARVRQTSPITVTRGRADERGAVGPSKCTMVLNNNDGAFTPDNPTSTYYGLLSRNTPLRYSFRLCKDTFTRTVSNGWGSTDTGQAWSTFGVSSAASDWNVGSGVGTQSIDANGESRISYLATESHKDVDVTASFQLPFSNTTGDPVSMSVILRGQSTSGPWYRAIVQIHPNESVLLFVIRNDGSNDTTLDSETLSFTHSGQLISIRAQVEGNTIRAKAWPASTAEPYQWHVNVSDSAMLVQSAGWIGVRSIVGAINTNTKPIVISWDNFEARSIRYTGEIASISPQSTDGNEDRVVAVEAAGVMRRLAQGRSQPKSAIERYVLNHFFEPLSYWPLDDGEMALTGRVARGNGVPATSNYLSAAQSGGSTVPGRLFGRGELAPWLNSGVRLVGQTFVRCGLPTAYTGDWAIHCAIRFAGAYEAGNNSADSMSFGEPLGAGTWFLHFLSPENQIEIVAPSGVTQATVAADVFDDICHHVGFDAAQSGSNVNWVLYVDGAVLSSGTLTSSTNVPLVRLVFSQGAFTMTEAQSSERAIGHVAFYGVDAVISEEYADAIFGHPGEAAGERIQRTCLEDGIPVDVNGSATATVAMGPQRTVPIIDTLQDCAAADLGTLYEPRGVAGIAYRPRSAIENQSAALALTYTSRHLSAPFEPSYDDQNTRNQITAERADGGKKTISRTTGPLNVGDPGTDPEAVGVYDESLVVNVQADTQLSDTASWLVHLGTVKEPRFPNVRVDVRRNPSLAASVLAVNVDDRITVSALQAFDIYDTVAQLARGMTEVLNTIKRLDVIFNTAPESPYHVMVWDSSGSRWDSDTSTLNAGITSSANSFTVSIGDGVLWTTVGAQFPFDIIIGGERMTVSAISGSSSPQTFTISARSVNGVVKAHSAGAKVQLFSPVYWGL